MENEKLQVVLGQGVTKAELVVREVSKRIGSKGPNQS